MYKVTLLTDVTLIRVTKYCDDLGLHLGVQNARVNTA